MNVKLKSLRLDNFKGCKSAFYDFWSKTRISGANASGKTTIFDAFTWLLFGKDSQGNEKFSIRPMDEGGNQIDNVEIKVSAVLEVDGREVELTKMQKQNWVKKRGTSEKVMQGNVNSFEIDGYPKSESDYNSYINNLIDSQLKELEEEKGVSLPDKLRRKIFMCLISPTYFNGLEWKEQREIVTLFGEKKSDYDMAKDKPEFAELLPELQKAPSTDDIQKKYQKALTEWKKKQVELPVRIDEAEKQKVDIDVAELELHKKAVMEQIAANKDKQTDVSKQFEEYQKLSDGVLELQFQLSDLQKEANLELDRKRLELRSKVFSLDSEQKELKRQIDLCNQDILRGNRSIERAQEEIAKCRERWKAENEREFDENNLVCSYCGQEYPLEKKEQLRAEFYAYKAKCIKDIEITGNGLKEKIDKDKEEIELLEKGLQEHKRNLEIVKKSMADLSRQADEVPKSIDISDTDEYKSIKEQIAEKEKAMNKMNGSSEVRDDLRFELNDLQNHLVEIEKQLALSQRNVEIDERISELQAEQREVAQKVADQEKMIYLLEQFIRYKMDAISASINSKFDGICFKLFDLQINGGLKETCECTVNGVPFGSLNNGHKIIAGLKIIKALQELYGVYVPVFVDNAEAISKGNLPEMDCQMILLAVSDDKELSVKVE